ncbi:MAG: ABC transporter permease [Bacteroidaceae bacterium]|nr:ABC transporter permease [Bacteroidaceae bacterium]
MTLVWKLLRRHVSVAQLLGFFFANLLGMLIVLLSVQFYFDLKPLILGDDNGAIKGDFVIVSKQVGGISSDNSFDDEEVAEVRSQRFVKSVGMFTASRFKVYGMMGIGGGPSMGTQMFFESVPDKFVDVNSTQWKVTESGDGVPVVPIILPRNYLSLYNFGFAQSQSLPQISEGTVSMMDITLRFRGNGLEEYMRGKVVGFSSRINTILVPDDFLRQCNMRFASGEDTRHSRLILEVSNPADDAIPLFMQEKGYEIDEGKLDAGKMMYFLRLVSGIVMAVGILISALSLYILMLSIFLLVQKNTQKLRNLLLIGYSPVRVSLPYQLLAIGVNVLVLCLALALLFFLREAYMEYVWQLFPTIQDTVMWPSLVLGVALSLIVCLFNAVAIHRKVMNIWNRED